MNTNNKIFKTDNKYQVLFEPIKIGPVIAKNRFYQVPHCNGGGYRDPSAAAEMRNIKSEGGWGVVFTEQVEMHHTSEITPYIELRLWDDRDIKIVSKMADKLHEYDTLAGIELTYPGINGPNLYTKEVPMAATAGPILTFTSDPVNAREMDKEDIRNLRNLKSIFTAFNINNVFHAAAYKHVPLVQMSYNIISACENNIIGTYNLAKTASDFKVDSFVMISTDKAVRPTNFMGASKRFSVL